VFTVAGTNGKGSAVAFLEAFLLRAGRSTGAYTSPHLVTYNERIRVGGVVATDAELVAAFERVEAARGETPLTFFEFGTLTALEIFRFRGCATWVLEVGMGGRLDAVNIVDADYALITTVDLDHEEYLGHTVEAIAGEKAGILRAGRPGFYGDWPLPQALRRAADEKGVHLHALGEHFDFTPSRPRWSWRGRVRELKDLHFPSTATEAQLRNMSLVLAVLEAYDPALIHDPAAVNELIRAARPTGRFQVVRREHEWILDVAHNRQAAATLRAQLDLLPPARDASVVIGMLGDKDLDAFAAQLGPLARRWICCTVDDARARPASSIAARLRELGSHEVIEAGEPRAALTLARERTRPDGRIVVCGSFRMVGPALEWLDIY
jgi:dihydrofolate synthase/folylpolyglutamate synthase